MFKQISPASPQSSKDWLHWYKNNIQVLFFLLPDFKAKCMLVLPGCRRMCFFKLGNSAVQIGVHINNWWVQSAHILKRAYTISNYELTNSTTIKKCHYFKVTIYLNTLYVLFQKVQFFLQLLQLLCKKRMFMSPVMFLQYLKTKGCTVCKTQTTSLLFLLASFKNSIRICRWAACDSYRNKHMQDIFREPTLHTHIKQNIYYLLEENDAVSVIQVLC